MNAFKRYLYLGQLSFLAFLLICVTFLPHYLFESNEGGASNYGVHAVTVIPYSAAFGTAAFCTWMASRHLASKIKSQRILKKYLAVLSVLYAATLLSTYPYKINAVFDNVHQIFGSVFLLYCLVLSTWLVRRVRLSLVTLAGMFLQFGGFIVAVLNYLEIVHLLFTAELLMAFGFSAVLMASAAHLASPKLPKT